MTRPDARRRGRITAVALLAITALVVDAVPPARDGVSRLATPLVRGVSHVVHPRDGEIERLTKARLTAEERARRAEQAAASASGTPGVTLHRDVPGFRLVMARVVSFTPVTGTGSERRVELDAGRNAGLAPSQAVVASGGLVGRITALGTDSATVTLLTDPASVVSGRIERTKALVRVTGAAPSGFARRGANEASLVVAPGGALRSGDTVVTAGSPGGVPYPPGLVVGRVDDLDADHGQLERTGRVRPSVDLSALDVVGVLVQDGS